MFERHRPLGRLSAALLLAAACADSGTAGTEPAGLVPLTPLPGQGTDASNAGATGTTNPPTTGATPSGTQLPGSNPPAAGDPAAAGSGAPAPANPADPANPTPSA
ncbi:MAG: hypothetical protein OXT09_24700 [Myxococcales bacterium]|nr:hypothetical protein [Myxococcales bacterium]